MCDLNLSGSYTIYKTVITICSDFGPFHSTLGHSIVLGPFN
jgi:hypothetical protein